MFSFLCLISFLWWFSLPMLSLCSIITNCELNASVLIVNVRSASYTPMALLEDVSILVLPLLVDNAIVSLCVRVAYAVPSSLGILA